MAADVTFHSAGRLDEREWGAFRVEMKYITNRKQQDPCGAVYDPATDTYHLMYQWHPYHVNWGK